MKEINISKVIMAKRREKDVTQDELAEYIGVTKASVSKWETSQSYPDITLLPQLATYFNISIDELVGYSPQMSTEDIRKTYHRLSNDFSNKPFDEVIIECRAIIKKYYSCFPLLMKMAILLLNYHSLLNEKESQQALLQEIIHLCVRIKSESDDANLSKQANSIEAMCLLSLGQPNQVLELVGEINKPIFDDHMMLAYAYQMTGRIQKAKMVLQVSLYQYLLTFMETAHSYLYMITDDPEKFELALQRFIQLSESFNIEGINPNLLCKLYYVAAQGYAVLQNKEKALEMLYKYANACTTSLLPFKVKGDIFFDSIEEWFLESDIDLQAPRDEKTIKNSILQTVVENPIFNNLHDELGYQSIIRKLIEFAEKSNN